VKDGNNAAFKAGSVYFVVSLIRLDINTGGSNVVEYNEAKIKDIANPPKKIVVINQLPPLNHHLPNLPR